MLKKLRHKFVFTNMLLVFLVIVVVFSAVCVVNYNQRVSDIQMAVAHAAQNNNFSHMGKMVPLPEADVALEGLAGEAVPKIDDDLVGGGLNGNVPRRSEGDQFVATSTYDLGETGNVTTVINDSLGLDSDVLNEAVAQAWSSAEQSQNISGHIGQLNLYYSIDRTGAGATVAFASGNYVDRNMMSLMLTLGGVCVLALVAFFFISLWLSRWALRPVERTWAQQQQFVADASHELKTPLTVILANNSIIESQPQSTVEEQMKWVESTRTEAEVMQGLVNDLLFLARPEDEEQQLQMSTVNLSDVVQNIVLQFESVAFERGVSLEDNIVPGIELTGDSDRLSRLVSTLVDNACKYVDDGGKVVVALTSGTGHPRLTVHNTGAYIDEQDIPHLFDRFWRADKARTQGAGGFGLGLSIAREVVDQHGGNISVESSSKEGTTFTVTF